MEALHITELDRILGEDCGLLLAGKRGELRGYLDSIAGNLPAAFDAAFAVYADDPAVMAFAAGYFRRYRKESGLTSMLQGSETLTRFERSGVWTRLSRLVAPR